MRAAVIVEPGNVEVRTVDDPVPSEDGVVVEVASTGLCGTDLHVVAGHHGVLPIIPGHEVAGIVVALGRAVTGLRLGDQVAVDPNLPCRRCRQCRRGLTNLCPELEALGITKPGGAADLMAAPEACCVVLPEGMDLLAAPLIEPLSCALHGYDVLARAIGDDVLILGAGTMGLMMLALGLRSGATTVHVVEPNDHRRAVADRMGCSGSAATIGALERQEGWDVVIDATGSQGAIVDGLGAVGRGGTYLQFGVADPSVRVEFSPYDVYRREITIAGSMAVLDSFERAVALLHRGFIDPAVLITDRYPLSSFPEALAAFRSGVGLKTQIVAGPQ
ncbi:MAG TPA: alcohol dehydrogenase catalytic domain-containing protein [Acidimicrobiales bacterium]|nr:alcohol dehydrogenase catalytic domain-containing protein [Acidimicrobiales bacterium]